MKGRGETGAPRENRPDSGAVRHDSRSRKSRAKGPGNGGRRAVEPLSNQARPGQTGMWPKTVIETKFTNNKDFNPTTGNEGIGYSRSDEALGVRVSVSRIAPSLFDLDKMYRRAKVKLVALASRTADTLVIENKSLGKNKSERRYRRFMVTSIISEALLKFKFYFQAIISHHANKAHRMEGSGNIRENSSSGTIPTCENPGVTRPRIEPGSPLAPRSLECYARRDNAGKRIAFVLTLFDDILRENYFLFDSRRGRSRISACENRAGRFSWSRGFSRGSPVSPRHLHSDAVPYSRHFTLIGSQDLDGTKASSANIRHDLTRPGLPCVIWLLEPANPRRWRGRRRREPSYVNRAARHSISSEYDTVNVAVMEWLGFLRVLPLCDKDESGILNPKYAAPCAPEGRAGFYCVSELTLNAYWEGKIMQGEMHRGKEKLGSHGLHFRATTTSLSVLRASLNYEEQGKNRQERRKNTCERELIGLEILVERRRERCLGASLVRGVTLLGLFPPISSMNLKTKGEKLWCRAAPCVFGALCQAARAARGTTERLGRVADWAGRRRQRPVSTRATRLVEEGLPDGNGGGAAKCSPPIKANRGSIADGANQRFSQVGIVPDDTAGRRVSPGNSRSPPPPPLLHSGADPYLPRFSIIYSQDFPSLIKTCEETTNVRWCHVCHWISARLTRPAGNTANNKHSGLWWLRPVWPFETEKTRDIDNDSMNSKSAGDVDVYSTDDDDASTTAKQKCSHVAGDDVYSTDDEVLKFAKRRCTHDSEDSNYLVDILRLLVSSQRVGHLSVIGEIYAILLMNSAPEVLLNGIIDV
ncbi:hypothetical protein PR048_010435 [Dryococelus australis]|uniref:Uncharacterized protein n=1 Tax=Dryococelus australis TaxID=614101 RepID=A0ABQ9I2R4_9NEOP|nr:hypothetical protein PR048_010435 [Dryococelus australis]